MQKRLPLLVMALLVTVIAAAISLLKPVPVVASDHDDGSPGNKGKARNLTDVIVFETRSETGLAGDEDKLTMIMTVNDRSVARQQYFFDNAVNYDFNVERVAAGNQLVPPSQIAGSGTSDLIFRYRWAAANAVGGTQTGTLSLLDDPSLVTLSSAQVAITAAPPGLGVQNAVTQNIQLNSNNGFGPQACLSFAGHREDQFFFDVEQYFRVRAGAVGLGPAALFRDAATARDFPQGYNLLAIVLEVPGNLLRLNLNSGEGAFDFWGTITL